MKNRWRPDRYAWVRHRRRAEGKNRCRRRRSTASCVADSCALDRDILSDQSLIDRRAPCAVRVAALPVARSPQLSRRICASIQNSLAGVGSRALMSPWKNASSSKCAANVRLAMRPDCPLRPASRFQFANSTMLVAIKLSWSTHVDRPAGAVRVGPTQAVGCRRCELLHVVGAGLGSGLSYDSRRRLFRCFDRLVSSS